jgi:hypothetical protein
MSVIVANEILSVGGTVKKRKFKYYDRYQNDNRSDA